MAWDIKKLEFNGQEEIKACCEENGWNLIHIFRDEGMSRAKLNEEALEIDRVGLQEMLAHLSSVQIQFALVLNTKSIMALRYCEGANSTRAKEI